LVGVEHLRRNSHYQTWFFENQPMVGFKKTNFGVSSAFGAGNTKIGFIMRTAGNLEEPLTFGLYSLYIQILGLDLNSCNL
jgi:hypothetical protein